MPFIITREGKPNEAVVNMRYKMVRKFFPAEPKQGKEREKYTYSQFMKRFLPNSYLEKKLRRKISTMTDEEFTTFHSRKMVANIMSGIRNRAL